MSETKKPNVVIENNKVIFTDLGDGTTQITFKDERDSIIVSNVEIVRELLRMKNSSPTSAYSHTGN